MSQQSEAAKLSGKVCAICTRKIVTRKGKYCRNCEEARKYKTEKRDS